MILPDGGCVIYGRSDATLNRGGVRMGTSEFYRVVERAAGGRRQPGGRHRAAGPGGPADPVRGARRPGAQLDDDLAGQIKAGAARRAVAAARAGRDPPGARHPADAVRQEARGAGPEDPARHAGGRRGRPGRAGQPRGAALLRRRRREPSMTTPAGRTARCRTAASARKAAC